MNDAEELFERRRSEALRRFFDEIEEHSFGIVTQLGYQKLENKITEHNSQIERRFHNWFVAGLVAFSIIAVATGISLIGFGIVLSNQSDTDDKIQTQRYDSILQQCNEQNDRHTKTIAKAQSLPENSEKTVTMLVKELQPYTPDCKSYARNRVKGRF